MVLPDVLVGAPNARKDHLYVVIIRYSFLKSNRLFEISQFFFQVADLISLAIDEPYSQMEVIHSAVGATDFIVCFLLFDLFEESRDLALKLLFELHSCVVSRVLACMRVSIL